MKKLLLLALTSFTLILSACGTTPSPQDNPIDNDIDIDHDGGEQIFLSNHNEITMTCKEAIQAYLDNTNPNGQGAEIKAGDNITVDYVGRLDEETIFDTSVESIAQACEMHNPRRDYNEGLTFEVGARQMIAGFDEGVIGMKVGQTKTVSFGPEQGYGPVRNDLIMTYPLSDIPNPDDYQEGMKVYSDQGMAATITKKTNREITLDMNHELAGKTLIFDITIKSINN